MNISMPMWLFAIICLLLLNIGFLAGVFWRMVCKEVAKSLDYDGEKLFSEEHNGED